MACCIVTAFIIHRSIKALQYFNAPSHRGQVEVQSCKPITVGNEVVTVQHLSLSGMTCESCCAAVENVLRPLPGIVKVTTSLLLSSATIVYQKRVLRLERIRSAIHEVGYRTSLQQDDAEVVEIMTRKKELEQLQTAFQGAAVLSAFAWCWSYAMVSPQWQHRAGLASFLDLILSIIPAWFVQVWYARSIHLGAWWHGDKTNMDMLLSTSILLGLEYSFAHYFFINRSKIDQPPGINDMIHTSNALLVTVVLGGRYLNQALRAKVTSRISALHEFQCAIPSVLILPERRPQPTFLLQANDRILIPPDSLIPCDCFVAAGSSFVDQSLLTGEAAHLTKNTGDLIMSGTHNISSTLEAVVTHPPEKSSLARLIEAVRASTVSSADMPVDIFPGITTFTAYFAKAVMALAFAAFLAVGSFSIIANNDWTLAWSQATRRAMLILAVACPCSLSLATPAATMAGLNAALGHGILVKGGLGTMAKLATLTHMAFDKTGTLTRAGLDVSHASFVDEIRDKDVYAMLCAVEKDQHTRHVVGRAVFGWAYRQLNQYRKSHLQTMVTKDLIAVEGKGVVGKVSLEGDGVWTDIIVGSARFLHEGEVPIEMERHLASLTSTQVLHVGIHGKYAGFIVLEDLVRPDAAATLQRLRKMGLEICMITGDNKDETKRVADALGIPTDRVTSEALPWDKETAIREIQNAGGVVAMIGDGANDLAAQSAADISVAVCAGGDGSGLGATLGLASSADVTLFAGSDLNSLCELVRIAKRTVLQARINLIWALVYNTVGLLAATGCLDPLGVRLEVSITGMIMAMSSVSVLLLSQRVS